MYTQSQTIQYGTHTITQYSGEVGSIMLRFAVTISENQEKETVIARPNRWCSYQELECYAEDYLAKD